MTDCRPLQGVSIRPWADRPTVLTATGKGLNRTVLSRSCNCLATSPAAGEFFVELFGNSIGAFAKKREKGLGLKIFSL